MRIAILSDIHEDYQKLKEAIRRLDKKGFDKLACLGDICGFSAPWYSYYDKRDAHGCLSLLRERCDIIIPGNHDMHAAGRIPESSSAFPFPANWYELEFREKEKIAEDKIWLHDASDLKSLLSKEEIEYLRSLPEYVVLETPGRNILFSHYIYPNLSGFLRGFYQDENDFSGHFSFMKERGCQRAITGHAHIRGFYTVSEGRMTYYSYRKLKMKPAAAIFGVPPLTRHKNRSGFCIFDNETDIFQAVRL